jgi:hypothetical protein
MRVLKTLASTLPGAAAWLIACAPLCLSQKVQLVPNIAVAEAEYRDANEAWLQNDPNLASDLFKIDSEDARRRIHRAAALSDDVMAKKERYLQLIIERFQDTSKRLVQPSEGLIPTAAMKRDLEAQQARILDEQARVEDRLRDLPPGDEYLLLKRALTNERSSYVALHKDIGLRIRSLESIGEAQDAIRSSASNDSLTQKLDGVLRGWEEERAGTIRQRSTWAEYYSVLERSLDQKEPEGKGRSGQSGGTKTLKKHKGKKSTPNPQEAPPTAPAKESAPPGGSAGLAGSWIYRSNPSSWTGNGEPEIVTSDLRRVENECLGSYAPRPPARSDVDDVQLMLRSARQSDRLARLRWKSQTFAGDGGMEIRLSGDGRVLVERAESDGSHIPRGMEVLLTT